MIESVIKTVAKRLMKNPEDVFLQIKENVIRLFEKVTIPIVLIADYILIYFPTI